MASLIGAAFVFPGVGTIDAGTTLSKPPFLSGLGPVFLVWLVAPFMALTLVTFVFLVLRTSLLRGEDPFHKVLWVRAFVHMLGNMTAALCIRCQHGSCIVPVSGNIGGACRTPFGSAACLVACKQCGL